MARVAGKVALVAGSGGGIGRGGRGDRGPDTCCRMASGCVGSRRVRPVGGRCGGCRCGAPIRAARYRARIGRDQSPAQFPGSRCRDLGPYHRGQSDRHVSPRTGGGAANGEAGRRRQHHQRDLATRRGGAARARRLCRLEGRRPLADTCDGGRSGAARHPCQRDCTRPDADRADARELYRSRGTARDRSADPARPAQDRR